MNHEIIHEKVAFASEQASTLNAYDYALKEIIISPANKLGSHWGFLDPGPNRYKAHNQQALF